MSTETTVFTMRHGRTAYNAERRYAGSIDISLNETGIQDAQEATKKLAGVQFDVIIASTLKRSIETARIIASNSTPIIQNKLCVERNFGVLEGLTWDDVQSLTPPVLFIKVGNDLHSVNPGGSEPFEVIWERAKKFNRFLFKTYLGSKILVISHGVFLQMYHGLIRGYNCIESLSFAYPANLEISVFKFHGHRLIEEKEELHSGSVGVTF